VITKRLKFGSLLLMAANAAVAQAPPKAIGQPRLIEPYGVLASTVVHHNSQFPAFLAAGIHKPITNPSIGLFGIAAEFYLPLPSRLDFSGTTPGVRALLTSRALGLSGGIDFDITSEKNLTGLFSFQTAIRRGGILGRGTMVRLDWYPWRDHELSAGIFLPIAQPFAGRTRSRDTDVDPPLSPVRSPLRPARLPARAEAALSAIGRAATMILAYTNLFAEDTARVRYGESFQAAMRSYDDALAEAFRVVAGNPLVGDSVVRRARNGLLDAVLLPYDSLFGQAKEHPKSIRPLTVAAHASFLGWLRDSSRIGADAQAAAATVHSRWLETIEAVHAHLLNEWKDSRLVWLPLQLALTETDYDEQSEVDALVERAVGRPFTDNNALTYLRSSDLPLEIARSIFAARDYHVLWTHDFTGQRAETKTVDEVAYAMVADAYLPALTRAVQRYDSAGSLTQYFILLDQFYYGSRNGRLWMDILENPLRARIKLPGSNAERELHLRARQLELHNAVRASRRLQQDAAANGGDRWLRKTVRVHVNILLPPDFSFRSHRIVPPFPFVPDNVMRDHRKMVFYDITESDSYRGAVILMGVGIGEHYASPTWEDRGYRVRGPAALEVREAVRRALRAHRIQERDIPLPLRADGRQPTADSSQSVYVGRALQVHNESGFGAKESSVARAMLYNLAPPGSVIIVPDPIWVSETWAAMLAGAAARGCKVYVIAPSAANNPNPHGTIEAMENFVMSRLLDVRHRLAEQMRRTGGELRVGLYTARAPVDDVAGRTQEVKEGLRRAPWLRQVIPFDDATLAVLDRAVERSEGDGKGAKTIAQDEAPRAPQLHQKTQLIARPGAIQALVRQPGWQDRLAQAMRLQSEQTAKFGDQFGWTTPAIDSAATRTADAILWSYEQGLSETDRKAVSFYFSTGTQNMDPRGLMLDGEATLVVSGVQAAAGLVDLYYMMARSTWIERKTELDRLLPLPSALMQRLARMIRYAL
jgi:phosphatidylserine/phosphatidylglycerophosphate/cardiolipin synthase-like enzyme